MSRTLPVNRFTTTAQGLVPAPGTATGLFLSDSGTWVAAPAAPTGANPTAKIGLGTVNGSATTFLRSDGAQALDVTISPTWTGNHTFSPSSTSGVPITLNGQNAQIVIFNGSGGNTYTDWNRSGVLTGRIGSADSTVASGATTDFGISCTAGGFNVATGGSSVSRFKIDSSGNITGNGLPIASTGSFTAGTTGQGGATITCKYTITGNSVTLYAGLPSSLTSSLTTYTITGLPAAIQPATAKFAAVTGQCLNNGAANTGAAALVSGSTITLYIGGISNGWTASGNKNIGDGTHGAVYVWDLN